MFKFIVLFLSLSFGVAAQDCSTFSRAIVTDQKNISYDLSLGYLQLNPSFIIDLETTDYVSWRGDNLNCLIDIYHYMQFKLVQKSALEGQRCVTTMDVYVKDHFSTTSEREIKPRNVKRVCYEEDQEERAVSQQCAAAPTCPMNSRDGIWVQDYSNNCECILFDQLIGFDDVVEQYEEFYNFKVEYKKPSNIQDLFAE